MNRKRRDAGKEDDDGRTDQERCHEGGEESDPRDERYGRSATDMMQAKRHALSRLMEMRKTPSLPSSRGSGMQTVVKEDNASDLIL